MFTTDSRTEKFLDWMGTKWQYSNAVAFATLAPDWTLRNSGRSQIKVDQAIREYGLLMDKGSSAPAPILWLDSSSERYEVLDGMQRLMAEQCRKVLNFSAYIVETDSPVLVKKLRVFANYRLQGGYQESAEWTLANAIELLVNQGGMSVEEVAEMGGWTPAAVRDKKQCIDCGNLVRNVGGPEKLPDSVLRIIAKNSQRSDFESAADPLGRFFSDIKTARLSADEAEPYIEDFFSVGRTKGSAFDQFNAKLEEFRGDEEMQTRLADPSRRRYQPMTCEGRLMRAIKAALTTAERVAESRERITYMAEYFQLLAKVQKVLKQIETNSRRKR